VSTPSGFIRRGGLVILAVVLAVGVVAVVAEPIGLPGPSVLGALGLADDGEFDPSARLVPCRPDPAGVRTPRSPAPGPGRWEREGSSPLARDELDAAVIGDRVFLVGGHAQFAERRPQRRWSLEEVLAFDSKRGRYAAAPSLPEPLDHAAAVAHEGNLYVVGGYSNESTSNRLWRYSPATRRWTRLAPMGQARGGLDAAVIGDKIYAVGGKGPGFPDLDTDPYATLEVFDIPTGRWTRGPDMPTARHHLGVAAVDAKLYAVGGREADDLSLGAVEAFDPATGVWETLADLPQHVGSLGVTAGENEVFATGGGDDSEGWVTPATWAYSPERRTWRRMPDLRQARHGHTAAVVGRRLWVFGGAPCDGYGGTASVESLTLR
jgi:hypothetical protein